jgi:hypothetical protein
LYIFFNKINHRRATWGEKNQCPEELLWLQDVISSALVIFLFMPHKKVILVLTYITTDV